MSRGFKIWVLVTAGAFAAVLLAPFLLTGPNERQPVIKMEMNSLEAALQQYHAEYAKFPRLDGNDYREINRNVTVALTPIGPDQMAAASNPKGIEFLRVARTKLVDGLFCDPWGSPYRFAYATNLATVSSDAACPSGIAVWSVGRNGKDEDGRGDDVLICVSAR